MRTQYHTASDASGRGGKAELMLFSPFEFKTTKSAIIEHFILILSISRNLKFRISHWTKMYPSNLVFYRHLEILMFTSVFYFWESLNLMAFIISVYFEISALHIWKKSSIFVGTYHHTHQILIGDFFKILY